MAMDLDSFIGELAKGGMRPNLFTVEIKSPYGDSENLAFKAKAASLPAVTIPTVTLPYMGRQFKVPGDQEFADWNVTVILDEGLKSRKTFEDWMEAINGRQTNVTQKASVKDHMITATVSTYSRDGTEDAQYEFYHLFPNSVGEVSLAWDSNNSIAECPMVFSYSSFKRIK
jgi:hypothetical protein